MEQMLEPLEQMVGTATGGKGWSGVPPAITTSLLGLTKEGRNFVYQRIHPCGTTHHVGLGVPDGSPSTSTKLSFYLRETIPPPTGVTIQDAWDCMMIIPATDQTQAIYASGPAGTNFATGEIWGNTPAVGTENGVVYFPNKRQSTPFGDLNPVTWARENCDSGRIVYKGVTVELNAPNLANQGVVYAGQVDRTPSLNALDAEYGAVTGVADYTVELPFDEEALMTVRVDRAYQGQAADGVYLPFRFVNEDNEFRSVRAGLKRISGLQITDSLTGTEYVAVEGNRTYSRVGGASHSQWDAYMTGSSYGVVFWRGISGAATLNLKIRMGEEILAVASSPLSAAGSSCMEEDEQAMSVVDKIQGIFPDAFPADHNDRGKILGIFGKVFKGLSAAGSLLPGPVGTALKVANAVVASTSAGVHIKKNNQEVKQGQQTQPASQPAKPKKKKKKKTGK